MHEVVNLEKSLLDSSTRASVKQLQILLSENFVEFGSSGKIYNKKDILKSLPVEEKRILEMRSVNYKFLSTENILVTYKLFENCKLHSLRSSVWLYNDNRWQIIFHQGTLC